MPSKGIDPGVPQILNPIGVLDAVLESLAGVPALEHIGIMDHSRKALQDLSHYIIHRDFTTFAGFAFLDSDHPLSEIYVRPTFLEVQTNLKRRINFLDQ